MSKIKRVVLTVTIPLLVVAVNTMIILFPKDMLEAAREGLNLWLFNVLPALLPFVIGVNLLTGLGAAQFIGVLCEPVMRRVFRVSGAGGFPLVMGMLSGFPIGAKITAELRAQEQLSKADAQKILAFSSNAGPLFVLGTVGAGLFKNQAAGILLLSSHYLSALLTGLIFSRFGKPEPEAPKSKILARGFKSMEQARRKDGRKLGELLAGSVKNGMETMLVIGGFILLFAIIIKASDKTGLLAAIARPFGVFMTEGEAVASAAGIIEMTNGVKMLSQGGIGRSAILATAGLISFSGLSIHAQAAGFISRTDLSVVKFIGSKVIHAVLAVACAWALYPFMMRNQTQSLAVYNEYSVLRQIANSALSLGIGVVILLAAGLICVMLSGRKRKKPRDRSFVK